jgi:DNA (cytosine-5)-methyltransferase 1
LNDQPLYRGGFPCQPHSCAGKRKASTDERDLWPEMRRVIGEIKPRWVVAENVPGLLSSESGRFFRGVLRDFAEMGYDAGWCVISAASIGAIHRRERVAIIAHANENRQQFNLKGSIEEPRNLANIIGINSLHDRVKIWSGWKNAYTQEEIRGKAELFCLDDGVSTELDEIGCYGNAVVPAQFYPFFAGIAEIERSSQ